MKVEKWNSSYKGAESKLVEILDFPDGKEGFKMFYDKNNELKYCNGSHYSFVDQKDKDAYKEFFKEYHTITNYYRGGVVD